MAREELGTGRSDSHTTPSIEVDPPGDGVGAWGRRAIAEGVGTFFLVLIGPGAAMVDARSGGGLGPVGVALAFAFVVVAMIYAIGHLSGAHINPAVTIAFWGIRRFPGREVGPYVAAQLIGATVAAATLRWLMGSVGDGGVTVPRLGLAESLVVEFLLSFALMFVIVSVATDERVAPGFAGLAVGLTVGFDALMGGPLTGGSMNPARSFGPAVASGIWTAHWLYWIAPIVGAIAAARAYEALRVVGAPTAAAEALGVQGPLDPSVSGR